MSLREARCGSWKKLVSIETEHHRYKEYDYKVRLSKKSKPTNSWDDMFNYYNERNWKNKRLYQCKAIKTKIIENKETPLIKQMYRYKGKDLPHCNWYKLNIYYLACIGTYFHDGVYGAFLSGSETDYTTDEDYCTFIPMVEFWNSFEKIA